MRVLIGCERSRVVARAFEQRGHEVLSCDLEPARKSGPHYQGNVFDVIDFPWDLAIFHPPCTHTAVSGAKHFAAKREDGRLYCGVSFIMSLVRRSMHIPNVAIEQPVSILSSLWRKPDQIIQPWQFGHGETKATCLWLRGCPPPGADLHCRRPGQPNPPHAAVGQPCRTAQRNLCRRRRGDGVAMGRHLEPGARRMTPETELARLFRAAADEYAEQLKRTPTPDAPEPMEDDE